MQLLTLRSGYETLNASSCKNSTIECWKTQLSCQKNIFSPFPTIQRIPRGKSGRWYKIFSQATESLPFGLTLKKFSFRKYLNELYEPKDLGFKTHHYMKIHELVNWVVHELNRAEYSMFKLGFLIKWVWKIYLFSFIYL